MPQSLISGSAASTLADLLQSLWTKGHEMFEQEKVTNQNVYIKIAGAKSPVSLFIKEWTAAGIWVQSDTLHLELAQQADEQGIPGFLEKNPLIFLPHHRVEWVMATAKAILR